MSYDNRFLNESISIIECFSSIYYASKEEVPKIKTEIQKIDKLNAEIQDLKSIINNIVHSQAEFINMLIAMENRLINRIGDVEELKNNIGACEQQIAVKDSNINNLNEELVEIKNDNKEMRTSVQNLQNDLKNKNELIADKSAEAKEMGKKLDKAKEKIERLIDSLDKMEEELKDVKAARDMAENTASELKNKLIETETFNKNQQKVIDQWSVLTYDYRELLQALTECPAMDTFMVEQKISKEINTQNIFRLAMAIGMNNEFAVNLYNSMKNTKKVSKEEIDDTEKRVYAAVNKCYRTACGIKYDIFVLPPDSLVTNDFSKIKFDRNCMEDLSDPRNKEFKFAEKVYVPALRSLTSTNLFGKSQVGGINR